MVSDQMIYLFGSGRARGENNTWGPYVNSFEGWLRVYSCHSGHHLLSGLLRTSSVGCLAKNLTKYIPEVT